jgi:hypothetical protein
MTCEKESISNRGLRGLLLNFRLLFGLHSRIPANEGLPELVIETFVRTWRLFECYQATIPTTAAIVVVKLQSPRGEPQFP